MKISDLARIYQAENHKQISKEDVIKALNTMRQLGTGVCLMNNQYLCTVPFALSNDVGEMLSLAEKVKS